MDGRCGFVFFPSERTWGRIFFHLPSWRVLIGGEGPPRWVAPFSASRFVELLYIHVGTFLWSEGEKLPFILFLPTKTDSNPVKCEFSLQRNDASVQKAPQNKYEGFQIHRGVTDIPHKITYEFVHNERSFGGCFGVSAGHCFKLVVPVHQRYTLGRVCTDG